MLLGIQSGHQNIQNNVDPLLRPGTGAPGEVEFTVRIRDRLGQILISKGFQVQLDDANANSNPNTIGKDFSFYLAIHYDANIYGTGGGCISAPDPSVDSSNAESKRIVNYIEQSYFVPYTQDTGIVDYPNRISNDMKFYYMWNVLTAKTPCGLIECGVGQDAHDSVILADTDRVCNAIAKGICKAFSVPWEVVPLLTTSTTTSHSTTSTTLPAPPVPTDYKSYLVRIKQVMVKGWFWQKLAGVNQIIKESGV